MKAFLSVLMVVLSSVFIAGQVNAQPKEAFKGFIDLDAQHSLYVDYVPPHEGQPTVILLNGLTYSTTQWDKFVAPLMENGVGILRYDPVGMGQTLLRYAPVLSIIPMQNQVQDLEALLQKMNFEPPYNLAGLSYGGGLAAGFASVHPEQINKLILMAPFTRPLDSQDTWIKSQIWLARQMNPWNPMTDEDMYDFFLHQIVYATYPQAEPIVLENPFKLEAIFRMAQGVRHYIVEDMTTTLPAGAVHLMVARQDQYIPANVLQDFWNKIPAAARASRIFINGSEHKMVEAVPHFTAAWVYDILTNTPEISGGKTFEGYPLTGEAVETDSKGGGKFKVGGRD